VPFRSGLAQRDPIYVSRHFHPFRRRYRIASSRILSLSFSLRSPSPLSTRHLSILRQRPHEILRVDDVDDINPSAILPYCVVLRVVVSPLLHRLHASMHPIFNIMSLAFIARARRASRPTRADCARVGRRCSLAPSCRCATIDCSRQFPASVDRRPFRGMIGRACPRCRMILLGYE